MLSSKLGIDDYTASIAAVIISLTSPYQYSLQSHHLDIEPLETWT
jgi:hypothetical protein